MARRFNSGGVDDRLLATAPVTSDPYSFNVWLHPFTAGADNNQCFVSLGNSNENNHLVQLSLLGDGLGTLRFIKRDTGSDIFVVGTIPFDAWTMISVTDGPGIGTDVGAINIYLNGSNVVRDGQDTRNPLPHDTLSIGATADATPAAPLLGGVAELSFWDIVLTDQQVADLWNNGVGIRADKVVPDSLVGDWPFLEGDGDINRAGSDLDFALDPDGVASMDWMDHPPTVRFFIQDYAPPVATGPPTLQPAGLGVFSADGSGSVQVKAQPAGRGVFSADASGDVVASPPVRQPAGLGVFSAEGEGDIAKVSPARPAGLGIFSAEGAGNVIGLGVRLPAGQGVFSADASGDIIASTVARPSGLGVFSADAAGTIFTELRPAGLGVFSADASGAVTVPLKAAAARRVCKIGKQNRLCEA